MQQEDPKWETQMTNLFDTSRHYQPADPEILETLGSKEHQAQMRHSGRSPVYFRLGRKIIYHGADLNKWANAQRIGNPPKIRYT